MILVCLLSPIAFVACSTPAPVAYESALVVEPEKQANGLEFVKLPDRDLNLSYAVAMVTNESIYILVEATNVAEKPILVDPGMFTLKNETKVKLAARDPDTVARGVERSAIGLLAANNDATESDEKPISPEKVAAVKADAKERQAYISRNFLRRKYLPPGASARGYILFYTDAPTGKWTLVNKITEHLSASRLMTFEVK